MASRDTPKVCFPIAGRPAIVRAIDTYKAAGLRRFVVVVGQLAEKVVETVGRAHPDTSFVYQDSPRGTGHAALVAVDALEAQGYAGDVMVVMGDKVTRPPVVRRLLEARSRTRADALITALPKPEGSSAGRVVTESDGRVLGIVEAADIDRARRARKPILLAGRKLTASRVERMGADVNLSMYVFRFAVLRDALARLRDDNAQGELYLTDTIEHVARRGRVEVMRLTDPTDLMAFNTPEELLEVEKVILARRKPPRVRVAPPRRLSSRVLKPAGKWLAIAEGDEARWRAVLRRIYGTDESIRRRQSKSLARVVRSFVRRHGPDRRMVLIRAPGRVNLMGRHVDHRGGFVNVMAINREVVLAGAPRDDDLVTLHNLEPRRFGAREFRISRLLRGLSWADWIDFIESHTVQEVLGDARGDWSHYARAALLRLQHECSAVPLRGMDCVVAGDIPMGAGLSSSSALVVAFASAAVALNRLRLTARDFVDLCGEGEWFVGSRGGSADHAAISTSRLGCISRIGFYPFRPAGEVRFPDDLRVVVAHSGTQATKSAAARDQFNQRVACYELAEMYLRRHWAPAAGIEHLRDLTPERLDVRPGEIYRAIARLPDRPTRRQLAKLFAGDDRGRLEQLLSTHADVGRYDLRGVALYGISEVLRSQRFADAVRAGDSERMGRFMRASHDGDRIVRFDAAGRKRRHVVRLTDAALGRLAGAEADLTEQSGRYACSTEDIDRLVDVAQATEGVVGAQLAGAGLGGCMMILVRADALSRLNRRLRELFYKPRRIPFGAHVCSSVAGAGLISV